jgi:hypothetical protein
MDYQNDLIKNKMVFFNYMKEKYEVHYKSNIFLRDILYSIKSFYEKKGQKINYPFAEQLAMQFTEHLENQAELVLIEKNTWKVNFSFTNNITESDIE